MSQQVYEPKLFAHGTVPGSRTYVNSEHEQSTVVVVRPKSVILTYVLWLGNCLVSYRDNSSCNFGHLAHH